MFKLIKMLFIYRKELSILLNRIKDENEEQGRLERTHHLKLCKKHQQEQHRSPYSEKNCDYCKLLNQLDPWGDV